MDFYLSTLNKTVRFEPFNQYVPDSVGALSTPAKVAGSSSTVLMLMATVVNIQYAMAMMKIYQMMDFMLLYNVDYPANFQAFLQMFQTMDPMEMLPDVMKNVHDENCPEMGEKFIVQSMGCQFLSNTSTTFFLFIMYFGGKLIVTLLALGVKGSGRTASLVRYLKNNTFGASGLFNLLAMFDMDFLIASFTNSKYYGGDELRTVPNILNMGLAITFIFLYPGVILYYFLKTRRILHNEEGRVYLEQDEEQRFAFLIDGRRNDSFYSKYREVMSLVKNYCICLMLVSYYDQPQAQLITTLVILATFTVLEIVYRPSDQRRENVVSIIVGICYTLLASMFLTLIYVEDSMSMKEIYVYLGYPMIGGFSLIIIINTFPIVQDLWKRIVKLFSKKGENLKSKTDLPNGTTGKTTVETKHVPEHKFEELRVDDGLDQTNDRSRFSGKEPTIQERSYFMEGSGLEEPDSPEHLGAQNQAEQGWDVLNNQPVVARLADQAPVPRLPPKKFGVKLPRKY